MKTEFLTSLGLEKDVADKILAKNGKDIEALRADLQGQLATVQGSVKTANAEIERYKSMDIDAIQKAATDWEQKAKDAEIKATKELEAIRFDTALSTALSSARARNPKAAKALLNIEGLKLTETGIVGLSEQLESIKRDNSYLFEPEPSGGPGFGNQAPPDTTLNANNFMNNMIRGD